MSSPRARCSAWPLYAVMSVLAILSGGAGNDKAPNATTPTATLSLAPSPSPSSTAFSTLTATPTFTPVPTATPLARVTLGSEYVLTFDAPSATLSLHRRGDQ